MVNASGLQAHFWFLNFNTTQIGTALAPGEYDDAQRAAFTSLGHPGLELPGMGAAPTN